MLKPTTASKSSRRLKSLTSTSRVGGAIVALASLMLCTRDAAGGIGIPGSTMVSRSVVKVGVGAGVLPCRQDNETTPTSTMWAVEMSRSVVSKSKQTVSILPPSEGGPKRDLIVPTTASPDRQHRGQQRNRAQAPRTGRQGLGADSRAAARSAASRRACCQPSPWRWRRSGSP